MERLGGHTPDRMGRLRARVRGWFQANGRLLMASFAGAEFMMPREEPIPPPPAEPQIDQQVAEFAGWLSGITPQDFHNQDNNAV